MCQAMAFRYSYRKMAKLFANTGHPTVLQLGFEGRGAPGRAHFARSYKNEGTM